jgi:hypothetical protein
VIAAEPIAPRASALGSLAGVGVFIITHGDRMLFLAGQFLVKDVVLLGASLVTASESLRATERP